MTLEQAEEILQKPIDHHNPTPEQREAKNVYFNAKILPAYDSPDDVPWYLEPDAFEGWTTVYP